jgi:hypothetical protein
MIEKMKAMEAATTKGTWWVVDGGAHWNNPSITNFSIAWSPDAELVADTVYTRADADFLVAMKELTPELLALWEAVKKQQSAPDCHSTTLRKAFDALEKKAASMDA